MWLSAILGHLGLHSSIAERLGAEPQLFQVVQLAVLITQERGQSLGLPIGVELADLLIDLELSAEEVDAFAAAGRAGHHTVGPAASDHVFAAMVGVSEELDGFDQRARRVHEQKDTLNWLPCQVYCYR